MSADGSAGLTTVLGLAGRPISLALEHVHHSILNDDFAEHIRQPNDQLDGCLHASLDELNGSEFPLLSLFRLLFVIGEILIVIFLTISTL